MSALTVALVGGALAASTLGQLSIGADAVVGSVLRALGIPTSLASDDPIVESTLWAVRFPRIAMGLVVGAALAAAGAVMQAVFGNPLAEPAVVGVSTGSALGAAAAIVIGGSAVGVATDGGWLVATLAFAGGLAATIVVYAVARSNGRTEVVTLLLTGIAVNAFAGAGLALLLFLSDAAGREQIVFWQLGSLNGTRWHETAAVAIVAVVGVAVAVSLGRRYDLLALGERSARHLGVDVERLRIGSIVLVALLTAVTVAFCGIIAFVGLIVPHLVRMASGPAHRHLVLASAVGGGALIVIADLAARTLVAGAELPIGMLTSLLGGPFFFYLLHRQRKRSGAWA